jgi:uncharacterized protein
MGDDGWKDMPALISRRTIAALSNALGDLVSDQLKPFATVLHGGEPLMLGASRLEYLFQSLRLSLPESHVLCIQTNGTLINDKILEVCAKYRVSLSISLDGPKEVNDRFRVGKRGESTHERVAAGINLLRQHEASEFLYAGLLCVIDPTTDAQQVYEYFKSLDAPSMDFLYRDGNHTELPFGKASFESTEYAEWLGRLTKIYLSDPNPPKIRFLDDIIRLSLGGRGIKEGLGQEDFGIAIIETDGSISKNDTLKSAFNGADRFEQNWSIHTDRLSTAFSSSEFKEYHALQKPSSSVCKSCEYINVCGGGMPLHRWSRGSGFDNPSVYCNDQKMIIGEIMGRLQQEGLLR